MERLIIVSNRLPVKIHKEEGKINIQPSVGGLATGMKSVYKKYDSTWFGWAGIDEKTLKSNEKKEIEKALEKEKCYPVYICEEDVNLYYSGFSNKTIWPLFHYFMQYTDYNYDYWEAYIRVNRLFASHIIKNLKKGDKIWIHDYHLLLLPKLIKEEFPDVTIGFFLHIPFPSYELFRVLPWRKELLEGMLGADLLGFHTYDYERHFLSTVRRLFGYDTYFNQIFLENRVIKTDAFPMGIDYEKFHSAAIENRQKALKEKSELNQELEKYLLLSPETKLMLSIDRLDYSKGIPKRLEAYEYFLDNYPEYRGKVTLVMLSVPSRSNVEHYQLLKSEVDELVGRINGKFSMVNWTPIWYFYRSMPFENLIELYTSSEIAFITPVRDGMNLVAKEYIASRIDKSGVLILSEMAGAYKELSEALIINPNNKMEIAEAIKTAIEMPKEEQQARIEVMQDRIMRYSVKRWASDFIEELSGIEKLQQEHLAKKLTTKDKNEIVETYKKAKKKIIFLNYDGTLISYEKKPENARPDPKLQDVLQKLSDDNTHIVLITGRDKETLEKWFKDKEYTMISEHGIWIKEPRKKWEILEDENFSNEWKEMVKPVIEFYVDRTPGTFFEEKEYSISWHYRKADPDLGNIRALELKEEIGNMIANLNLEIIEGHKVIDVKNIGFNTGKTAKKLIASDNYDFILALGSNNTVEETFNYLPESAITIKVGYKNTLANYNIDSYKQARKLLEGLI